MFNVWALVTNASIEVYSGDYRTIAILPVEEPQPDTIVHGLMWVRIGKNLTQDQAELLASMYPSVSRAKC